MCLLQTMLQVLILYFLRVPSDGFIYGGLQEAYATTTDQSGPQPSR